MAGHAEQNKQAVEQNSLKNGGHRGSKVKLKWYCSGGLYRAPGTAERLRPSKKANRCVFLSITGMDAESTSTGWYGGNFQ